MRFFRRFKLARFASCSRGAAAVEFSLTAPAYLLLLFVIAQVALWLWTTFALQHGAEAASRCASIQPTTCSSAATIQNFAAANSYGLRVTPESFAVNLTAACGTQVTASVQYFEFMTKLGVNFTATAAACFPK